MTKNIPKKEQKIKILKGEVVSTKMKDTIVVKVQRYTKHPKLNKYINITKKYKVHDLGNLKKMGETVFIKECRPLSKDKNFIVV